MKRRRDGEKDGNEKGLRGGKDGEKEGRRVGVIERRRSRGGGKTERG